ncbi:hypothetical protein LEP1GSC075_3839 [Leptospira interrogans str. Kito]|uniref:Uncharacterized protein n=2 Tax=Leptospira interrogans TaxID=173 RepID=N1UM36_LEPIR|nr:hypothetical protein LIMLP_07910 [Leptospira interrogans serovar Manilae]EKO69004.1 hypothetical protein LEP1GSC069_0654 [Leptospira interrogans serovar Canicola str. Fiocruz LV133]EMK20923.1 hypothetical protein LEP1GSC075_3839 [Leptospira interrogans str. Kito]EMN47938.1 hypothetical protein LEP1GSC088_1271 [Leptospira interrogans str. L1207]EMN74384.1 hypothetical protein LEP1GSC102_1492 [Leptospira interrogans str. UI 09600]EMY25942.1 hypothetical protein LEP1GSC115_3538 [Leptospira int
MVDFFQSFRKVCILNSSYFLLKIYRIESYKKGIFFLLRILISESVSFKIFLKKNRNLSQDEAMELNYYRFSFYRK